jgi:hypothetical protein
VRLAGSAHHTPQPACAPPARPARARAGAGLLNIVRVLITDYESAVVRTAIFNQLLSFVLTCVRACVRACERACERVRVDARGCVQRCDCRRSGGGVGRRPSRAAAAVGART